MKHQNENSMRAGTALFCSTLDLYWLARYMAGSWQLINACYMKTRKSLIISFFCIFKVLYILLADT